MITANGYCAKCGGTHYGSLSCPFSCDRCIVNTGPCDSSTCPRNKRWESEKRPFPQKKPNLAQMVLNLDKHISLHEMFAPEWEAIVAEARRCTGDVEKR